MFARLSILLVPSPARRCEPPCPSHSDRRRPCVPRLSCRSHVLVRCDFSPRTPPELKEKHCFFNDSEEIRGGPVGDACSRAV